MPQPNEYRHIEAWGILLQSDKSYIEEQQRRARAAHAPLNSVYFQEAMPRWITIDECSEGTQQRIARILDAQEK